MFSARGGFESSSVIVTVTGGTKITSGANTIRQFTSNGTLTIANGSLTMQYLLVGAGGNGASVGSGQGGGGGAGGQVLTGNITLTPGSYSVVVGANNSINVTAFGFTATTGNNATTGDGANSATSSGGTQNAGFAGGGGGSSASGDNATISRSGNGGAGMQNPIVGSTIGSNVSGTYYIAGGGGGGGRSSSTNGTGGQGGGGAGASANALVGGSGTTNTGGGGGGSGQTHTGTTSTGGSGAVVVSYTTSGTN